MKTPSGLMGRALYAWLVKNKQELLDMKKSAIKFADITTLYEPETVAHKGKVLYENNEEKGILKRTVVANTYNWLDSHGDVHLSGIFSKSIQERGKRIPHLHDHRFELGAKVGRPISFAEVPMKWRALGWPKNGDTTALVMETQVEKDMNPVVFREYLSDQVDQHSVSMQYVKADLAVNDENYKAEFDTWEEVFPLIGNKAEAEQVGYFWAIREAKLIEVSAVLLGSNELTPTLNNKVQPVDATGQTDGEPEKSALDVKELLNYYQPEKWTKKN